MSYIKFIGSYTTPPGLPVYTTPPRLYDLPKLQSRPSWCFDLCNGLHHSSDQILSLRSHRFGFFDGRPLISGTISRRRSCRSSLVVGCMGQWIRLSRDMECLRFCPGLAARLLWRETFWWSASSSRRRGCGFGTRGSSCNGSQKNYSI